MINYAKDAITSIIKILNNEVVPELQEVRENLREDTDSTYVRVNRNTLDRLKESNHNLKRSCAEQATVIYDLQGQLEHMRSYGAKARENAVYECRLGQALADIKLWQEEVTRAKQLVEQRITLMKIDLESLRARIEEMEKNK